MCNSEDRGVVILTPLWFIIIVFGFFVFGFAFGAGVMDTYHVRKVPELYLPEGTPVVLDGEISISEMERSIMYADSQSKRE